MSGMDSTKFPALQKARLQELIPEYEKFIMEKNPDHVPHLKQLSDWWKTKAKAVMQEQLFQDLVNEGDVEAVAWERVRDLASAILFVTYESQGNLPFLYQSLQQQLPSQGEPVYHVCIKVFSIPECCSTISDDEGYRRPSESGHCNLSW